MNTDRDRTLRALLLDIRFLLAIGIPQLFRASRRLIANSATICALRWELIALAQGNQACSPQFPLILFFMTACSNVCVQNAMPEMIACIRGKQSYLRVTLSSFAVIKVVSGYQ
jgi:hypothetical protein